MLTTEIRNGTRTRAQALHGSNVLQQCHFPLVTLQSFRWRAALWSRLQLPKLDFVAIYRFLIQALLWGRGTTRTTHESGVIWYRIPGPSDLDPSSPRSVQ
jgi:hypothetical protein